LKISRVFIKMRKSGGKKKKKGWVC